METEEKVKEIIAGKLQVDVGEVTDEASLQDDLGADSLDAVELIMAFEDEFGIDISDEKAEGVKSVGDAIALVKNLVAQKEE